jgi:hypothetical protein
MSVYFSRLNTLQQVNLAVAMLNGVSGEPFATVGKDQETFEYRAPDGDVVFSGLQKTPGVYICRFHREVFDPS